MWAGTAPPIIIFTFASFIYKILCAFWPSDDDLALLSGQKERGLDSPADDQPITGNRILGALLAVCVCFIGFQLTVGKLMERNIAAIGTQLAARTSDALGQKGTIETRSAEICHMLAQNGGSRFLARSSFPFVAQHADVLLKSYRFEVMPDQFGVTKCRGRGHTNILTVHSIAPDAVN
jgi:hypothetical protein